MQSPANGKNLAKCHMRFGLDFLRRFRTGQYVATDREAKG
jgi:hypothetical protein